jgi:hypothetical protein
MRASGHVYTVERKRGPQWYAKYTKLVTRASRRRTRRAPCLCEGLSQRCTPSECRVCVVVWRVEARGP